MRKRVQRQRQLGTARRQDDGTAWQDAVDQEEVPAWFAAVLLGGTRSRTAAWTALAGEGALVAPQLVYTSAAALSIAAGGHLPEADQIQVALGQGTLADGAANAPSTLGVDRIIVPSTWSASDPYVDDMAVLQLISPAAGVDPAPFTRFDTQPLLPPVAYRYQARLVAAEAEASSVLSIEAASSRPGATFGVLQRNAAAALWRSVSGADGSSRGVPDPASRPGAAEDYVLLQPAWQWWDRGSPLVAQAGVISATLTGDLGARDAASIAYRVAAEGAQEAEAAAGATAAALPIGDLTAVGDCISKGVVDWLACAERCLPKRLWSTTLGLPDVRAVGSCPLCTASGRPRRGVPRCACQRQKQACKSLCGCAYGAARFEGQPGKLPCNYDPIEAARARTRSAALATGNIQGCLAGGVPSRLLPPIVILKPPAAQWSSSGAYHADVRQSFALQPVVPVWGSRRKNQNVLSTINLDNLD